MLTPVEKVLAQDGIALADVELNDDYYIFQDNLR